MIDKRNNSPRRHSRRVPWFAALMLSIVGFVGIHYLDAAFINIDELSAFGNMGGFNPPYGAVQIADSIFENSPDHMPLWFILAAGLAQITGWSQVALRLVSLLTSLLVSASIYRFALENFGRKTANIAIFLFCANAYLLQYTYRILMYPLLMLLAVFHCYLYWRIMCHNAPRWCWPLFVLTAASILYVHLFGVLFLIGIGVHHLFFVARSKQWAKLALAWAVACLVFLPYLPRISSGYEYNLASKTTANVLDVLVLLGEEFLNGQLLLLAPILLSLGYALFKRNPGSDAIVSVLRIALVGCIAYLLLKLVLGEVLITRIRYFFSIWFVIVILVAYGLASIPRWFLAVFMAAWGIAFVSDLPNTLSPAPSGFTLFRSPALHTLRALPAPAGIFVGAYGELDPNTKRGIHDYGMVDYTLRQLGLDSIRLKMRRSDTVIETQYQWLYSNYARFILGFQPSSSPTQLPYLFELIKRDFTICDTLIDEPAMTALRIVDRDIGCQHQPVPTTFVNGLAVQDRFARHLREESQIIVLTWIETADQRHTLDHNISWQIITEDWRNVRQVDKHLSDSDVLPWSRIEISTAGLQPGQYRLMLILYRNDTGAKIYYIDPVSGQESGFLPILDFTISSGSD